MTLSGFRAVSFNWDARADTHMSKRTYFTDHKSSLCPKKNQVIYQESCKFLVWTKRQGWRRKGRNQVSDCHNWEPVSKPFKTRIKERIQFLTVQQEKCVSQRYAGIWAGSQKNSNCVVCLFACVRERKRGPDFLVSFTSCVFFNNLCINKTKCDNVSQIE